MALPVRRHPTFGPRSRLVDRMVLGCHQRGPLIELLSAEVPEPVLSGLEASNYRVTRALGMTAGVLTGGRIAAADMAALGAAAQVEPPTVGRQTFDTARPARRHRWINLIIWHE
jgi:hypothetical protein